jgi:hypothetical protein
MSLAVHVALAVGPLAAYFATLGVLQGGRRPVVVPGPLDFGGLAVGLGGLIVFGPVGNVLVNWLFPAPSVWAWLALASGYGLIVLLLAPRAGGRVVVYNVEPEILRGALHASMARMAGGFAPTVEGYEDAVRGLGVRADAGRLRAATIEAYGAEPERLIAELAPVLREHLATVESRPSRLAPAWFALATLTVLLPFAGLLLSRSPVIEAVRNWLVR